MNLLLFTQSCKAANQWPAILGQGLGEQPPSPIQLSQALPSSTSCPSCTYARPATMRLCMRQGSKGLCLPRSSPPSFLLRLACGEVCRRFVFGRGGRTPNVQLHAPRLRQLSKTSARACPATHTTLHGQIVRCTLDNANFVD